MGAGTGAVLQQNFSGHVSVEKKNANKPVVLLSQTRMTPNGTAQWKASLLQSKSDSGLLKKTKAMSGGAVSRCHQ